MSRRVVALHALTVVWVVIALVVTVRDGVRQPAVAAAFGLLVLAGEAARVRFPGRDHPVRPLATAGALGYALLGEVDGRPAEHGVLQVVAVVSVATLAGRAPRLWRMSPVPALLRRPPLRRAAPRRRARTADAADDGAAADGPSRPGPGPVEERGRDGSSGRGSVRPDLLVRRLLCVAFAAACFQPLHDRVDAVPAAGTLHAVLLLVVLLLTAGCDAVLAAALTAGRHGWPYAPLLRDGLRAAAGIVPALSATGAVLALAVGAGGLWTLPVCWVPLLLVQFAVRRYADVRATYRQTIASLARATEVAGYTPHGHARRVAALSRAMARELRLTEPELTVLEYAALMHDIGQLSLVDPLAGGATEPLEESERRRIALLGGAVVRQTGVPAEVALVVERQADPWRDQPLTARVVRVANAYEDLASGQDAVAGPLRVLERMRLSGSRDYDPRVVEALARVVTAGEAGPAASGAG